MHTWPQTGANAGTHTQIHTQIRPPTFFAKNTIDLKGKYSWMSSSQNCILFLHMSVICDTRDFKPFCVFVCVLWGLQEVSQIHTGSYVLLQSDSDRECYPEQWTNTLCAGSCIFHIQTDTRTNRLHSLLTHVRLYTLPPVSFYLKAWCPSYFLFCTWPQNSSHLACLPPIIHTRNTLVCLPEELGEFQYRICINSYVLLSVCIRLLFFLMESCWFLFENPPFFSRTGSNPVETSGDDSGYISDTHHMWLIILRLACPRQIGLCIFSDSPIHIHGTRLWWHIGPMKVFPVFLSHFKGVDGYLHWWCDTGSTLGQSSPHSPAPPKPL